MSPLAARTIATVGSGVMAQAIIAGVLCGGSVEVRPHLRPGQLVLSVLAGATTRALTSALGHDQVVRSMPNTPARLGKGMTVWYATPEVTAGQRAPAGGP